MILSSSVLFLLCKSPHATLATVDDRTCPKEKIIFQGSSLHLDQLLGDGGDIALEFGAVDLFDLLSLLLAVVSVVLPQAVRDFGGSGWAAKQIQNLGAESRFKLGEIILGK